MIFFQYAGDEVPDEFNPNDADIYNMSEFDNPLLAVQHYIELNKGVCAVTTGFCEDCSVYVVRCKQIKPFMWMYFDASDYKTVQFHVIADIKFTNG
jgi:hypothetical protein